MTVYQPGQRIALVHTDDPYTHLRPGDTGTVQRQVQATVYISWDNGSTLAMCLDAGDRIRPLPTATAVRAADDGPWASTLAQLRAAGTQAGRTAADWWAQHTVGGRAGRADGDTRATARRILAGIADGDPALLDTLPRLDPSDRQTDTSADRDLYTAAVGDAGPAWAGLDGHRRDAAIGAYRDAFHTAAFDRVGQLCRAASSPTGRDVSHLHPDRIRIGSVGVFAGDWSWTDSADGDRIDGDRIDVAFAGILVDRWNGWAVFSCTRPVAEAIVADQQHHRRQTRTWLQAGGIPEPELDERVNTYLADLRFDGDVIIADQRALSGDPEAIEHFTPDVDGRYVVMGWNWCWMAVDPYRCDRIVGDLPDPGDQQQFEVLRHTTGIRVPHTRLQLSDTRPHHTAATDGEEGGGGGRAAFTAALTLDGEPVATVIRDETGDETGTWTADVTAAVTLDPPDAATSHDGLRDYLSRCRYQGRPVTTARLLQALADEYHLDRAVTLADASGATLLRLVDDTGRIHTLHTLAPIPADLRELLDLGRTLTRPATLTFEIWTGNGWSAVPGTRIAVNGESSAVIHPSTLRAPEAPNT
ncbi:DUF4314 domain-containing protein [Actinoplanes sp. NPDC051633]|uniref:DUF4314 domain-containing protein n=1 Tax=Actinoplanes sp. NPDC051633 TaxID=3155670 RepID=UPI003433FAA7